VNCCDGLRLISAKHVPVKNALAAAIPTERWPSTERAILLINLQYVQNQQLLATITQQVRLLEEGPSERNVVI
jgi:hypothetical protein